MKKNYTRLNAKCRAFAFLLLVALVPAFYHAQQTYTFTNCGAVGRIGPTQAMVNAAYTGTNPLAGNVTVTGTTGIQTWTVPTSGDYSITAYGACGGTPSTYTHFGRGAMMSGKFALTGGTVLKILVGQKGGNNTGTAGAGAGGGGTFVADNANTPLIVAGGGAGGAYTANSPNYPAIDGRITSYGPNYQTTGRNTAGGGGGSYNITSTNTPNGGQSFVAGGVGGNQVNASGGIGGFGGGGGSSQSNAFAGGGGGYSGGDETNTTGVYQAQAGGGGSYNSGTNQDNAQGVNTGNGYVIITQLAVPCTASIETPTITGSAPGNSICLHAGETENLGVIYGSNAYIGVNYNWLASSSPSGPFSPVGTTTGPGFTTPGMGANAVYYMVEATCVNAGVTVASGVFGVLPNPTIALSSVPAINFTLSSLSVCTNDHYTVTASGAATYNWNNGASPATNVNPYVLTPVAAFPDYTVTGISAEGCIDTNTMTIATILDAPIVFLDASSNNICEGSSTFLMVTSDAYVFSWAPNINSNANLIMVTPTSSTEYTVTAAAVNGCSQTATQLINVNPPPVISVITSTTPGQVPCAGEEINMAASGATTYTWMSSGMYSQGPTVVVSPEAITAYYVSGTDQNGCTGTTIFNLVVADCVGITEPNANNGVSVYPNPNNGEFVVELNDGSAKSIELYDLTGRMILSNTARDNKVNVTINHLSNGVYYLKITSDSATKMVKVVKQ